MGITQLIESKVLKYYFQYIRNMQRAFQEQLKLPTASYNVKNVSETLIYKKRCNEDLGIQGYRFSLKLNLLPDLWLTKGL